MPLKALFPSEVRGWRLGLLATAAAEMLRPLFVRWGSDAVRSVYYEVMDELWSARGCATPKMEELRAAVERLPEAQWDDSHYREIYIMSGLAVVSYALQVVQNADTAAPEELAGHTQELQGTIETVVTDFEAVGIDAAMLDALAVARTENEDEVVQAVRKAADQGRALIDAGLEPVAELHGWPVDPPR
jgi:hypothetical protein